MIVPAGVEVFHDFNVVAMASDMRPLCPVSGHGVR